MNRARRTIGLGVILSLSWLLNSWNITFSLGYHFDEPKKVRFIQTGTQDFRQPLLILQLARGINLAARAEGQSLVVLGRLISAAAGMLLVWLTYHLGRQFLAPSWALWAALLTAVCPLVVVHAHYLKEDVLRTACLLLGLLTLQRYLARRDLAAAILLGLACGLATSAHYKGLPLAALVPVAAWIAGVPYWRGFATQFVALAAAAAWTFVVCNFPLLAEPAVFWQGASFQASHIVRGHKLRILPHDYFGCFHLWHSVLPGIGWGATTGSLICAMWILTSWRRQAALVRLLVAYAVILYSVVELSPLKPDPNYERYVVPLAPIAALLTAYLLQQLCAHSMRAGVAARTGLLVVAVSCLAFPLVDSLLVGLLRESRHAGYGGRVDSAGRRAGLSRIAQRHRLPDPVRRRRQSRRATPPRVHVLGDLQLRLRAVLSRPEASQPPVGGSPSSRFPLRRAVRAIPLH